MVGPTSLHVALRRLHLSHSQGDDAVTRIDHVLRMTADDSTLTPGAAILLKNAVIAVIVGVDIRPMVTPARQAITPVQPAVASVATSRCRLACPLRHRYTPYPLGSGLSSNRLSGDPALLRQSGTDHRVPLLQGLIGTRSSVRSKRLSINQRAFTITQNVYTPEK